MSENDLKLCRVCGWASEIYPWGEKGDRPSFRLCPCCGVEFGTEDVELEDICRYRELWLADGAQWLEDEDFPEGWDLDGQMKNIPAKYLPPG